MPPKRPAVLRRVTRRPASGGSRGEPPAAKARRAAAILDALELAHPEATCALRYETPFQLVVATILSAQCTDERVNQVTPALFRRYPEPRDLAGADSAELEDLIRPTGFFRAKSKSLIGCARALVADHGGAVPPRMDALVKLPGIGRKTANVVLGHVFGIDEGIAVDTHVLRVSNRLGIASGDDPLEVERQLMPIVPRERWTRTTDLLIFHGRKICEARRPRCGVCPVFHLCRWESRQAFAALAAETPVARRPRPARAAAVRVAGRRLGRRLGRRSGSRR
jgi:endonuclease-3